VKKEKTSSIPPPVSDKKPEVKTTGHKKGQRNKERECPYCHKMKRNLELHIRAVHKTETGATAAPFTKETLTGEKPATINPTLHAGETVYYCQDCHAELRKGETVCWNCQAILNWEGID
jgi:hypothetical protein